MRKITKIYIHCTYTKPTMDIGIKDVRRWHTDPPPKGNGWSAEGYHWLIKRCGKIEKGRDEAIPGAHVAGHNSHSIGVALAGGMGANGLPDANYTFAQYKALAKLGKQLKGRYPEADFEGHRDVNGVSKPCPVIDTKAFFEGVL